MKSKMTIKDIAKEAGVSFKTVSRVINDEINVKDETREKVKQILKKYDFTLNYSAKNLSKSKTKQLLLISNILHLELPLQKNSIIVEHIVKSASKYGYNVILNNSYDELDKTVYGTFEKGYFDGAIILNPKSYELIDELIEKNIPVIISGINEKYKFVGSNQREATYAATNHLIDQGCKKIELLLDDEKSLTTTEKLLGYKKCFEDNNIPFDENLVVYNISKSIDVEKIIEKSYLENNLPDAYIINSDYASLGAIRVVNKYNIPVPEKLKIISFGDTYICSEMEPKLTAVRQNFKEIGESLVKILIDKIENNIEIDTKIIPAKLMIRDSSMKNKK